jgi:hypothetical protein
VRRGSVRVIVTTNFDRLIEQALESEGIFPQVIATPSAIEGMEPLTHARCTVIKLHGDYARIDQLNTIEELSNYSNNLQALLTRVLDEYGLVINGWSGDWDHALVATIEAIRLRRYPLFWATFGPLGEVAKRLVAQHRAHVIEGAAANEFLSRPRLAVGSARHAYRSAADQSDGRRPVEAVAVRAHQVRESGLTMGMFRLLSRRSTSMAGF